MVKLGVVGGSSLVTFDPKDAFDVIGLRIGSNKSKTVTTPWFLLPKESVAVADFSKRIRDYFVSTKDTPQKYKNETFWSGIQTKVVGNDCDDNLWKAASRWFGKTKSPL